MDRLIGIFRLWLVPKDFVIWSFVISQCLCSRCVNAGHRDISLPIGKQIPNGKFDLWARFVLCVRSGWRRASPTSRRASIGAATWSAMSPTTMWTTGSGHRSSSEARPIESTSNPVSQFGIVPCSRATRSAARRLSPCSTTNSTRPPGSRPPGSQRATSWSVCTYSRNPSTNTNTSNLGPGLIRKNENNGPINLRLPSRDYSLGLHWRLIYFPRRVKKKKKKVNSEIEKQLEISMLKFPYQCE